MKPVWHIDGSDIIGLQGRSRDFVRIINGLLASQAAGAIPDAAVRLNVKDTEPDGGVDAAVDRPVVGDPTGFFEVPTCWQYKAQPTANIQPKSRDKRKTRGTAKGKTGESGKSQSSGGQEAALREEIRKPYARDLITRRYAYRFCIADDMPDEKKRRWEGWLTEEAVRINAAAPPAMVVTASDLARWVNRHPALVAGEFRQFPRSFRCLADWHRDFRSFTREFVPSAVWTAMADKVRRHVDFTRPAIPTLTIQGEAGVGKSRSVCEALLGDPAQDALVAITSDEKDALEFARFVAQDHQTRAILVADECSINFRVDLARVAEPCSDRLRLVLIDNSLQREGGMGEIRLDRLESGEVDTILERNFPGLPADRRRAYSGLAMGFVRLAVDLCRHDHLVPPDGRIDSVFSFFHDAYLKRRLRPEELDAVELVSLLPRVGYRDDVKSELEGLCSQPLVGLRADAVVKAAHRLKQAPGFIAFAGRYLYVTPTLIGQVAFQGAWDRWIAPDPDAFLSALQESFIVPFMRRVQEAGTEAMRSIVSDFFLGWTMKLGPPELGAEETVLRLVRLVEVRPEVIVPILRGLLEATPPDDLRRLHSSSWGGQQARRQLVWLAEKLSHFSETFTDAESILLRLAAAETESHLGNNASHVWAELFRIGLSGTPIPFRERLALLDRRLVTADATQQSLALSALDEILADGPVSRLATPPALFGRIPPPEWRPADQAERRECRRAALEMAARIALGGERVADGIRGAVVRRLSPLLLAGFLDEVRAILGPPPLSDALLIEVVRGLEQFLDVFCREHEIAVHRPNEAVGPASGNQTGDESRLRGLPRAASVELEAQVRDWYHSLIPGDLHSRLVSLVGQEFWRKQLVGDADAWQQALAGLASEMVRSPAQLQRELGWLCSPDARSAFPFGQVLAEADAEGTLLHWMLRDVPQAGGTALARGYLERVAATRLDLLPRINEELDRLQAENPRAAYEVVWSAGNEVRKVHRLFAMVDQGVLGAEFLRGLEYGERDRQLGEDELLGAVDRLIRAAQDGNERAAPAALQLLHGWIRPGGGKTGTDRLRTCSRVRKILPTVLELALPAVSFEAFFWIRLAEDLTAVDAETGVRLLAKALVSRDSNTRDLAAESLIGLAKICPSRVMEAIGESALSPTDGWMFRTDDFSGLLAAIPEGVVRDWLDRAGKRGARAIARHLPPPGPTEKGEQLVPPLTEFILSRFEDDDEVFREFLAGTHAGRGYTGDISTRHDEEAETARQFLGHPLKRVREWAAVEMESAREHAQHWPQFIEETAAP